MLAVELVRLAVLVYHLQLLVLLSLVVAAVLGQTRHQVQVRQVRRQ
jgi:hypothetical protein